MSHTTPYRCARWICIVFLFLVGRATGEESDADPAGGLQQKRIDGYLQKYGVEANLLRAMDLPAYDEKAVDRFVRRGMAPNMPFLRRPEPRWWQDLPHRSPKLNAEEEVVIGWMTSGRLLKDHVLLKQPEVTEYVNLVGRYMADQSPRPDLPYRFYVLQSRSPEAYATPGGFIFVSVGIFKMAQEEDDVAFVLGHEVAHVARFHGILAVKSAMTERNASEAFEELGQLSGKAKTEGELELEDFADYAYRVSKFYRSRTEEDEADRLGADSLGRAGYRRESAVRILRALKDALGDIPAEAKEESTHPPFSERIKSVENHLNTHGDRTKRRMVRTQTRFEEILKLLP